MAEMIKSDEEQIAMMEDNSRNEELVSWVLGHCQDWRDYRNTNYQDSWDEYERIWRGIWDGQDKTRESERSRIISPATQQAVEAYVSELDEAIFGKGDFFDIEDNWKDENKVDIEQLKRQLKEDFKKTKMRYTLQELELLSAVYGTGVCEITVKEKEELAPATQPIPGTNMAAVGVMSKPRFYVYSRAISPRNFLIDPNATDVDNAMGCAIEEYVSKHLIVKGMEDGIYNVVNLGGGSVDDPELEPFYQDSDYQKDKVKILKYYGLVPRDLISKDEDDMNESKDKEEFEDLFEETNYNENYVDMVEAIVVIANDGELLKAEVNPYMMKDRPVAAFRCDIIPGRFWGRGIVEKGYNMQKAIDGQLRAHMDNLALTTAPMMAMDATRMPRGATYTVRPGKTILTNGNPNEIMMPMKFGQTDTANATQAREFERMLLMATGTFDTSSIPSNLSGEQTATGISMLLGAIIKKNKRMIVNFQENFLMPFISKVMYRYMQFDPENYPAQDFDFIPTSTLGIMAREYEQQQFIALLQTIPADSPAHNIVLEAIIANSNLGNKQEMIDTLKQSIEPTPEAQQMQQQQMEMQMRGANADISKKEAEAARAMAEAQKASTEAQLAPQELQLKAVQAASTNLRPETTDDFAKRAKIAELMLKEKDIDSNERIAFNQMRSKVGSKAKDEQLLAKVEGM